MDRQRFSCTFFGIAIAMLAYSSACKADDYTVDGAHSGVGFKISHLGLSWTYGRFNEMAGSFSTDANDASKAVFELNIKSESIDTNNPKRDGHLRSADFFDVKQFPAITFKSSAVKEIKDGYEVTGDFTMHGVTKQISFALLGGRKVEMKGMQRTGYSTELTLKRSEYGIAKGTDSVGDNVYISISFEGTKK